MTNNCLQNGCDAYLKWIQFHSYYIRARIIEDRVQDKTQYLSWPIHAVYVDRRSDEKKKKNPLMQRNEQIYCILRQVI